MIVALDLPTLGEALAVARRLRGLVRTVKIGSALFTQVGPEAVRRMRALGFEVMLDLKFFDIPSTVERSVRAATQHQVRWLTVHASGGEPMLRAAVRAARSEARRLGVTRPRVLAVTVLTSDGALGASRLTRRVLELAGEASRAGCDGVVASAHEAPAIRRRFSKRLAIFCPGIRPRGTDHGDQTRVLTPQAALAAGADRLIVGRPVTQASDPLEAARRLVCEI